MNPEKPDFLWTASISLLRLASIILTLRSLSAAISFLVFSGALRSSDLLSGEDLAATFLGAFGSVLRLWSSLWFDALMAWSAAFSRSDRVRL